MSSTVVCNRNQKLLPSFRLLILSGIFLASVLCATAQTTPSKSPGKLRFEISFPESLSPKPLDGHILLGISTDKSSEPRFQLREEEASSAQFFGLDVDAWNPALLL